MNKSTDQMANPYNNNIINNQFSNQLSNPALTPSPSSSCSLWDNHQSPPLNLPNQMYSSQSQSVNLQQQLFNSQGQPVNLQQPLFNSQGQPVNLQQQLFNSQGQPVNLQQQLLNSQGQPVNLQQQLFNSQGQPINLQQPIFTIVPTAALTPLIAQASNLQNYQQLLSQSTSLLNNAPFIPQQQYGQNYPTPIKRSVFSYRNNNKDRYHRQESILNHKESDLRKKLIRKRRKSCNESFINNDCGFQGENKTNGPKNWLKPTSAPLNLAPLKALTAINSESKQWFIVVEKDIILENYTFLDDMVTADPDCHLVVPHNVMMELRTHVSMSSDVRPRRTLRFLTQQIENGMAILGEQEEDVHGSSQKTLLTCMKLVSINNVVILIASEKNTLIFKSNRKGLHVFTIQDVKDILENKSIVPKATSPTMAIKIVVPNQFKKGKESLEQENNIFSESFNQYNYNDNCSNIEKKIASDSSPEPVTKDIPLEKKTSSPNNHHNRAMTIALPKVQERSIHRTPDKYSPSSSKIEHKQACNGVAPQISPTETTKAVPCNNDAVDEEEELSRRGSATYIAPTDPNNPNFHYTGALKKPSENTLATKYSPTKLEFASPKKMCNYYWNQTQNKNMNDTMETSSTSSISNISLDSIGVKKIISMKKLVSVKPIGNIDNSPKEITVRPKSPASYGNDNTSEPSLKETVSKNVVTEKSPTSAIISNSDSSYSVKVINPKKQDVRKVSRRRNVVMYKVACQSMEDVLRLRSEEWVFRFVQIMEEVLRVKLQEKIPHEQKEPAPWNLEEAAICIMKKFDRNFDVVDAANKLSRFLYETSDQNGNIINIEPSDYMELYSYGVYLVESLLDMCADCKEEDCRVKNNEKKGSFVEEKCSCHEVVTASELLKKLLFDIQNANGDTNVDNPHDISMDQSVDDGAHNNVNMKTREESSREYVEMNVGEMDNAENVNLYPVKMNQNEKVSTNIKKPANLNNLQTEKQSRTICKKLNLDEEAEADEVPRKVQRKVKTGKKFEKIFFNSLELSKKVENNKKINGLRKAADDKVPPEVTMVGTSSDSTIFSSHQFDKKDLKNADKFKITVRFSNTANAPDEPKDPPRSNHDELEDLLLHFSNQDNLLEKSPSKVVRTCEINEEIERRLKAKSNQKEYESLEPEDNINGKYNKTQDIIGSVDNTVLCNNGMAENETCERLPANHLYGRSKNRNNLLTENKSHENEKDVKDEAHYKYLCFIKNLSLTLAKVFTGVISLCNAYTTERMKKPSGVCPEELRRKAEMGYFFLFKLQQDLERASKCKTHEDNFKKCLQLENTEDYSSDDRFSAHYRDWLDKCTKMADEILKDVRVVLKAGDCGHCRVDSSYNL